MVHWKRRVFVLECRHKHQCAGECRQRRTRPDARSMHSHFPDGVTKEAQVTCLQTSFLYHWLVIVLCECTQKQAGCGNGSSATFLRVLGPVLNVPDNTSPYKLPFSNLFTLIWRQVSRKTSSSNATNAQDQFSFLREHFSLSFCHVSGFSSPS